MTLSRRTFIQVAALAGGGLAVGAVVYRYAAGGKQSKARRGPPRPDEINAWIAIDPKGVVTVRSPFGEVGQGSMTSVALLAAEELNVPWQDVRVEFADPNREVSGGGEYGALRGGGSATVRRNHESILQAGASARERLRHAAAAVWSVPVDAVTASGGRLSAPGHEAGYGEFTSRAAGIVLDAEPKPKPVSEWRVAGRPAVRLDVPAKVDGTAQYPMDVKVPGMVYAAVMACPAQGGRLVSFDDTAARTMPGVIEVLELKERDLGRKVGVLSSAVAVVADTWWRARSALERVEVVWDAGEGAATSNAAMAQAAAKALEGKPEKVVDVSGDAAAALESSTVKVSAQYWRPCDFAAPMSPPAAVADVRADRVDLWLFAKRPAKELKRAAMFTGVDASKVFVHPVFQGGSFGSGYKQDLPLQALEISRRIARPVKVIWTREEDMRRGRSRPPVWARLDAALGPEGYPSAVRVRAVGLNLGTGSIARGWGGGYAIDHLRLEYAAVPTTMQHGANRAPGFNSNTFMFEQFVDEMAQAAGIDPLEWRIRMTTGNERWQRVLRRLEQETRSLAPLPRGQGRGFAAVEIHDTAAACCAEVEISATGAVKVRRFIIVVNPGYLLNPRAAEEQVRGSIAWELGYVLHGGLDIEGGQVRNVNFDTYRPLRMSEMPEVQCHFDLSQDGWWGGMGEAAVPLVGPAVGNAIHAAIGKRVRSTPLSAHDLSWA